MDSADLSGRGLSRRGFLVASTGATLGTGLAVYGGTGYAWANDEFDTLRERYRESLIGPRDLDVTDPQIAERIADIDEDAEAAVALLDPSPERDGVFTDIPLTGSQDSGLITDTLTRLQAMAYAWAVPGGQHVGDDQLATQVIDGLRTVQLSYNVDQPEYDNWWDWEIGSAQRLGRICTVMYEEVPAEVRDPLLAAIDFYVPDPGYMYPEDDPNHTPSSGANRSNLCRSVVARGIVGRAPERMEIVRETLPGAIELTTEGDGLHPDGSFIQHEFVPYNGNYGSVFLAVTAELIALLAESSWTVADDPQVANLIDSVERAFAPWIFDGAMMSSVRGRAVAISSSSDYASGNTTIRGMLILAQGADNDTAHRWRRRSKGWIERNQVRSILDSTSLPSVILVQDLLANPDIEPSPEPVEARLFPHMDRAVHRGSGWAVSVSVASSRIARFEAMNGENRRPWHQGAGFLGLHLAGDEQGQFSHDYWPTVDPYRLPGTTVDSQPLEDLDGGGVENFVGFSEMVGGTVVGGELAEPAQRGQYGSVLAHEGGWESSMQARLSWFLLPDGMVCLGAGITGGSGHPVETIMENRLVPLDGDDHWVIDGTPVPESAQAGWESEVVAQHLQLPGTAGYLLLDGPRAVQLQRVDQTGTWQEIDESGSDTPVTRGYLTAHIDHGPTPSDADYAYYLLPGMDADQLAARAVDPDVEILSNTANVQAIHARQRGFVGANFYQADTLGDDRTTITADAGCSISILHQPAEATLEVSVADPTQRQRLVRVTCPLPTGQQWRPERVPSTVRHRIAGSTLILLVDTSASQGESHRIRLVRA